MTPERELLRGLRGDLLSVKDSPRAEVMIAKIDAILAQPETPSAPQKPSESPTPRTAQERIQHLPIMDKNAQHFTYPMAVAALMQGANALADIAKERDDLERELAEELEKKREVFIALHDRALKAEADLASAIANHAADLSAQSDKKEQQIKPQPRPGAYLLESTAVNADYWLKNGRELPDRDEAVLAVEQAINAWKGVAYGLAEKLHFAGYDPTTGSCAVSATAPQACICPQCGTRMAWDMARVNGGGAKG